MNRFEEARKELKKAGIPISDPEDLGKGWRNNTYLVDTRDGKAFLKIYTKDPDNTRAKRETRAYRLFAQNGIPVPELLYPIDGEQPRILLARKMEYPQLGELDSSPELYETGVENAGRVLARIHKIKGEKPDKDPFSLYLPEWVMREAEILVPEHFSAIHKFYENLRGRNYVRERVKDNAELTHGDYHDYNIFVNPETGEIKGVIDMEDSRFGSRHMDYISHFRMALALKGADAGRKKELRRRFVQAYNNELGEPVDPQLDRFFIESKLLEFGVTANRPDSPHWKKRYWPNLKRKLREYGYLS